MLMSTAMQTVTTKEMLMKMTAKTTLNSDYNADNDDYNNTDIGDADDGSYYNNNGENADDSDDATDSDNTETSSSLKHKCLSVDNG